MGLSKKKLKRLIIINPTRAYEYGWNDAIEIILTKFFTSPLQQQQQQQQQQQAVKPSIMAVLVPQATRETIRELHNRIKSQIDLRLNPPISNT